MRGASSRSCGVGPRAPSGSKPVAAGTPVELAADSASNPKADSAIGARSLRQGRGVCDMLREEPCKS